MIIRPFIDTDEDAVVALWAECGLTRAWNDPRHDIARKLQVQRELFLVAEADGNVVGTAMAGYEGHRGWVNYLAVAPSHQGSGVGRGLMDEVERLMLQRGCPKINIQVREDNVGALKFYEAIGFVADASVSLGKRLIPDNPEPA